MDNKCYNLKRTNLKEGRVNALNEDSYTSNIGEGTL